MATLFVNILHISSTFELISSCYQSRGTCVTRVHLNKQTSKHTIYTHIIYFLSVMVRSLLFTFFHILLLFGMSTFWLTFFLPVKIFIHPLKIFTHRTSRFTNWLERMVNTWFQYMLELQLDITLLMHLKFFQESILSVGRQDIETFSS